MKLIIVRHGETEENKAGILQGHLPGTLSHEGIDQGKRLANRLKDEKIDAIFSSDLKRAADTANLIGEYHPRLKIKHTKELREGSAGSWTGGPSHGLDWDNRPSDSESIEQMKVRAKRFLDKLFEDDNKKTVLLVSHAGFIRVLISQIIGKKDPWSKTLDQENTGVNIFEIFEDKSHKIHCLNCTKHLK
jgi:broad specificity phosphatase PhoE